jgi:hypothetical protein
VRPLVAVRHAVEFDPRFLARDPLFWPLARAARALAGHDDFPPVEALARVFEGAAPVRFVAPTPFRRRRRGGPVDGRTLYDARIALERTVPTRRRCWHDLMNALVWGTFPRAKLALHERQHRLIASRIVPGACRLSPRSPELDALALIDEGGIVVLSRDPAAVSASLAARRLGTLQRLVESGDADALVFGHAVYESLALRVRPAVVAALVLGRAEPRTDLVRETDDALRAALNDPTRLRSTRELSRVDASEARPAEVMDERR